MDSPAPGVTLVLTAAVTGLALLGVAVTIGFFVRSAALERRAEKARQELLVLQKSDPILSNLISVTVSGSGRPELIQGPVAAIVKINNLSTQPVEILLPYPNPNNLSFTGSGAEFAKRKAVAREEIERSVPIVIEPGRTHTAVYYLNRYLQFLKPGEMRISYQLTIGVTSGAGTDNKVHKEPVFEGEFGIRLVPGTDQELEDLLAVYASRLDSRDRQEKMQAAEALAFLDSPVSVDFVARMLEIDNLEVIGIRALGRFPSPKTHGLIVKMFSHADSAVVAAALMETSERKIPVPRQRIQELLTSNNPNTRWVALDWLARRPDKGDLPRIAPLLKDNNAAVRDLAKEYSDRLNQE